ncbi:MAG: hypothetical protein AAF525_07815 [Pseudomonadota bacterium]
MKDQPFYVGYLPTPPTIRKFFLLVIPMLLIVGAGVSWVVSTGQQTVGTGVWDVSAPQTFTGRITMDPYPSLHTSSGDMLLVSQGKRDASEFVRSHIGEVVSISGFLINRGDWRMLEVPGTDAVSMVTDDGSIPAPNPQPLGQQTLTGEIVDSKCFLGVMKPGSGKIHRACASLCLLGGIPPVLLVKDSAGNHQGYVMVNEDGSSAARELASMVAVPVEVSGQFERRGSLIYMRLQGSVTQLAGTARVAYGESIAVNDAEPPFCGVKTTG